MMQFQIRAYGPLRTHMPQQLILEGEESMTGVMLIERLSELYSAAGATLRTCRLAIGSRLVDADDPLSCEEVIALLPPSSGG